MLGTYYACRSYKICFLGENGCLRLEWIEKIAEIKKEKYNEIMDKIPKDFQIKTANREFILEMLNENTANLLELRKK